jgi:hypothetical protein
MRDDYPWAFEYGPRKRLVEASDAFREWQGLSPSNFPDRWRRYVERPSYCI